MCPVGSFAAASVRPGRAVCLRTSSLSVSFSFVATLLENGRGLTLGCAWAAFLCVLQRVSRSRSAATS